MSIQCYRDYVRRWEEPPAYGVDYAHRVREEAKRIISDGCSGVLDIHIVVCFEHDLHYAHHADFYTFYNEPLEQEDADRYLRWGIQHFSSFGRCSPMAWWRFTALSRKKGLGLGRESWVTGPERLKHRLAEPDRDWEAEHIEARKLIG